MERTLEIKDLVEKGLNYFRVAKDVVFDIFKNSSTLKGFFPTITAINDQVVFTSVEIEELIQPFQSTFTPKKGKTILMPETYQVRRMKVDKRIDPNDLAQTYLSDKIDYNKPMSSQLMRDFIKAYAQKAAEQTDIALINGKYTAPVEGEAGDSMHVVDGLKELVKNFVDKKKITPFETSEPMDETNTCDMLYELYKKIPAQFRKRVICYISSDVEINYKESLRLNYGTNTDFSELKKLVIRDTNCELKVVPNLDEGGVVVFTIPGNIVILQDNPQDILNINLKEDDWCFKLLMSWKAGIAFKAVGSATDENVRIVWCNNFDYLTENEA